jgi:hypothetical protein
MRYTHVVVVVVDEEEVDVVMGSGLVGEADGAIFVGLDRVW